MEGAKPVIFTTAPDRDGLTKRLPLADRVRSGIYVQAIRSDGTKALVDLVEAVGVEIEQIV